MRKQFTTLTKTSNPGSSAASPTVMGSWALFVGWLWFVIVAGTVVYLQITCWNVQSECNMYDMQGCDTDYSEMVINDFKIRCDCDVEWCPGQAGIPEDISLTNRAETTGTPRTS